MDGLFYALGFLGVGALVTIAPLIAISQSTLGRAVSKKLAARKAARVSAAAAATKEAEKAATAAAQSAKPGSATAKPATAKPAAGNGGRRRGAGRQAGAAAPAAAAPAPASAVPAAPQLGLFLRGVAASGRGVRAANSRYQGAAARFTERTHGPVAAALRGLSTGGVFGWLADRLDPPPGNVAPASAGRPSDPPPARPTDPAAPAAAAPAAASAPASAAPSATAPKPSSVPADPSTRLFGGNHVMGDILVPDKRVQAAMETVAKIADFVPAAKGGAWEVERMLQSLPELARSISNAVAFMTSNLDQRRWDPEVVRKLYAVSAAYASAIPPSMDAHDSLRSVYKPDFDAAETGGRRRVVEHQDAFDPQFASAGS